MRKHAHTSELHVPPTDHRCVSQLVGQRWGQGRRGQRQVVCRLPTPPRRWHWERQAVVTSLIFSLHYLAMGLRVSACLRNNHRPPDEQILASCQVNRRNRRCIAPDECFIKKACLCFLYFLHFWLMLLGYCSIHHVYDFRLAAVDLCEVKSE